jgi:hypothetical protein
MNLSAGVQKRDALMHWTLAILITAALIAGGAPICENEGSGTFAIWEDEGRGF